ncbi:hypothetical protein [Gordonia rhizosphera]|uniref:hypothetical protein n=1 Tax=Gordonia rhizosphera TaxID=83341 RepID=UPI0002F49282|nr:hypothetical protein [Gordonia rhizosphera]
MTKKSLFAVLAALVAVLAAGAVATAIRRSRSDIPPVSATVPRVEDLAAYRDGTTSAAS